MKVVLFDLFESQPAETSKFHGGGEYIKAVFKNLVENKPDDVDIMAFYSPNKFIDEWILGLIQGHNIKTFYVNSDEEVGEIFKKNKIDVFYTGVPYSYKRSYIPKEVKMIGTIHGLRFIEMPSDRFAHLYVDGKKSLKEIIRCLITKSYVAKKRVLFREVIDMLDGLVCVSKHTKYAIRANYPEFASKEINVFYTPQKEAQMCLDEKSTINRPYILLLGGDRWIKNTYRAILALERLFDEGYLAEYKVVIVGGVNRKIQKNIRNLEKYILKGYVETSELESLYKFCEVFLYPSLNEGFGMPPLEAMKYGRTCVVSGVCSLPEVCGDAVYYINPYDIGEMMGRILMAVEKRIPESKVIQQFESIYQRQKEDLDGICDYIVR